MDQQMLLKVQQLGKTLEAAKGNRAKLTGAKDQILASLNQSIGINSIEEAKTFLQTLVQKKEAKETRVREIYQELTSKFTW